MVQITGNHLLQHENDRLQDLQENIYRQVMLLLPDEIASDDCFSSIINNLPILHLQILEQHRYTTFVRLTYQLADTVSEPEAHIRVCHDLRVAEVTAFNQHQGIERLAAPDMDPARLQQIHWRQNRALHKWLDHLLQQGHSLNTMQVSENAFATLTSVDTRKVTPP